MTRKQRREKLQKRRARLIKVAAEVTAEGHFEQLKNLEVLESALGIREIPILSDDVLEEIALEFKNTPIEEPELYEVLEKNKPLELLDYVSGLEGNEEIDFKVFDGIEVGRFVKLIHFRVTAFTDDEGNYKTTPNTQECKLPNFYEVEELKKLSDGDIDDLKAKALEISGLDLDALTEWEKELVAQNVLATATDVTQTMAGGF